MAKIGLNNFRYGLLTEADDGTPTYGGAKKVGKAISCTVTPTTAEGSLYADDELAEYAAMATGADVSLGIDEDDDTVMAEILGHTISEDGQITRKTDDSAPYVGLGRVLTKMVSGITKYKVEFLYKVKFSEPTQENSTKGESIEFSTPTLEGKASALANGKWSEAKTFDTKEAAIKFLEGLLGTTA